MHPPPLCKILNTPVMSTCPVKQNDGTWVEKTSTFFIQRLQTFFEFLSRFLTFFWTFFIFFWNVFFTSMVHTIAGGLKPERGGLSPPAPPHFNHWVRCATDKSVSTLNFKEYWISSVVCLSRHPWSLQSHPRRGKQINACSLVNVISGSVTTQMWGGKLCVRLYAGNTGILCDEIHENRLKYFEL